MNKLLILVVEDDTSVRNLITTTLKAHDYRYLTAPNGQSAILEASSHNPDIVLLDLGLPDMDGVAVIEKIRSWTNTPIIVISARRGTACQITRYAKKACNDAERIAHRVFCFYQWAAQGRLCCRLRLSGWGRTPLNSYRI